MADNEPKNPPEENPPAAAPIAPVVPAQAKKRPSFDADQMEIIQAMIREARSERSNSADAISMYNMRDPKAIETVNVKRMYGKYVMGFKNLQTDPMKKNKPKWVTYKADPTRGLFKEPYVTLFLQENEKSEVEEKEMLLLDYTQDREFYKAKVVNIDLKKDIKNYGYLGSNGEFGVEVDENGKPVARAKVLAEVEVEERVFWVDLEGFSKPQAFISDFLA